MNPTIHAAVDLGAGSGRVLVGGLNPTGLACREVHRFRYEPRRLDGRLRWDAGALIAGVFEGLRLAAEAADVLHLASIGVDAWGVDYALLDGDGRLVEEPICYRDHRTDGAIDEVCARVGRDTIYARTGIQFQPFNTLYQLWAHVRDGFPAHAARLLLIPDYCHHALCGATCIERTNASTTQLINAGTGLWDDDLFAQLGLPRHVMPDIVQAGTRLGEVKAGPGVPAGLIGVPVVAPATHDTGSAVAGIPLRPGWAFISSGTWSLVGVERETPVLTPAAAAAGLTNESGVIGTTRLLTNVMGLWLLESCRKEWAAAGRAVDLPDLLAQADRLGGAPGIVDPDDRRFFAPDSMTAALRGALAETGQPDAPDPATLAAVILDSLALRYASVVASIERVTGTRIPGIHIVGGGSLNRYLNQAAADALGRPVLAGPVEATATGNLLMQLLAAGQLPSLAEGRRLLAPGGGIERFEPRNPQRFRDAARRFADLESSRA